MLGLALMALPIALGLHWWLGRWVWSLSVPALMFTAYWLLRMYVHEVHDYGSVGLIIGFGFGLPSVLFGSWIGALIGRRLRLASGVHPHKPGGSPRTPTNGTHGTPIDC